MKSGFTITHKLSQALSLLRQMAGNSPGVPLVLGPMGAGKSALAAQLCRKPPPHWRLARIHGSPDISTTALIRRLAADWLPGLNQPNLPLLLSRLSEMQREGILPVVVVDDAHRLPPEALRFLLQTKHDNTAPAFHAILFADSGEHAGLDRLTGGSDGTLTLYLSPWTREEVAAFYRLKKGRPATPRQLERLLEMSDGLPGPLVELMDDPSALNPSRFNLLLAFMLLLTLAASLLLNLPTFQEKTRQAEPMDSPPVPELTIGLDPPPQPQTSPPEPPRVFQPPAASPEMNLHDSDWLLHPQADSYCLQLAGFASLDEIPPYIRKHRLDGSDSLAWYRSDQEGKRPFMLVIGVYKDRRAAMRARLLLPDTIDPEQVEPRSFGSLQRILRKR